MDLGAASRARAPEEAGCCLRAGVELLTDPGMGKKGLFPVILDFCLSSYWWTVTEDLWVSVKFVNNLSHKIP